MSFASKVFAIRPIEFFSNNEAKEDNKFMKEITDTDMDISMLAHNTEIEFQKFVDNIKANKVDITVFDQRNPLAPDSIFPDWFTTHRNQHVPQGVLILYPMHYASRRIERDPKIITYLKKRFRDVIDLTHFEIEGKSLEGKGSLVSDYRNKQFFIALSKRANIEVVNELLDKWNMISTEPYKAVSFSAFDSRGDVVYHTDCMLTLHGKHATVCLEAIRNDGERVNVVDALTKGDFSYEILELSQAQIANLCANMQSVVNAHGIECIILSQNVYNNLTKEQIQILESNYLLIINDVDSVEYIGGGSCRCMLVEDFSPLK